MYNRWLSCLEICLSSVCFFFFFNDTATTEIYTLSLHDALPICLQSTLAPTSRRTQPSGLKVGSFTAIAGRSTLSPDRKSTRLNSSHDQISYAVFCLKKKKISTIQI